MRFLTFLAPDLTPLIKASQSLAQVNSKGNVVIYESTVYPGATEEGCIPEIEKGAKLIYNRVSSPDTAQSVLT